MMSQQPKATGSRGQVNPNWLGGFLKNPPSDVVTLDAAGIDKNLAHRARKAAFRAYAQQAKDPELIEYATELRKRAERRLGEMMAAQPKDKGGGDQGSNQHTSWHRVNEKPSASPATLAEAGIDKNLAKRARKAAFRAYAQPSWRPPRRR
jgi:hypothetical protein